jgi:lipid A 3-O-deacylase
MRARRAFLLIGMCLCASAARAGQLSILEENDSLFFTSDKHYTQGIRGAYLSDPLASDDWRYKAFDLVPPLFPDAGASERRFDWIFLGQSIFTPMNLSLNPPDPRDRPYAGWLYTGGALLQENGNQLTALELLLGVVGPAALGRQVQNDWHQFVVGIPGSAGWHDQLKNEPALALSYERRWRVTVADLGDVGIDVVPEAGVTAGNVFTYGAIGGVMRIGQDLAADYGPARIRPAPSGTDWFDSSRVVKPLGWYVFFGAEGRAVARNIFLDGNTFASSPHVDKKPLVADLTAGVALFWKNVIRLDIGLLTRTKEFYGQQGEDSYAGFRFSFGL